MADHKFRPEIGVLSAAEVPRRRHWSDADKFQVVKESFLGHRQVSATARRHGLSRSLLTMWRRQYRDGELGAAPAPSFIPLMVSPKAPAAVPATAQVARRGVPDVQLEIVLGN
jgi:transposase